MQRILIFLFFNVFLFFGCTPLEKNFKTIYYPEYKVIDRGGKNVIVKSIACSIFPENAISAAKRTAEYHLRSVLGDQSHRKEFKTINQYNDGQKTCIEISAKALRSF